MTSAAAVPPGTRLVLEQRLLQSIAVTYSSLEDVCKSLVECSLLGLGASWPNLDACAMQTLC